MNDPEALLLIQASIDAAREGHAKMKPHEAQTKICNEILEIMKEYHRQCDEYGYATGSPGGMEHMGDVWDVFLGWERELKAPTHEAQW